MFTGNHDRLKPCNDRKIPEWLERCKHRIENGEDISRLKNSESYCFCGGPAFGFMIMCDKCDEWYHGPCVTVTKGLADTMPIYHCPKCQFVTVNVCSGVSPSIFKDMAEISLDEISSTEWTEDEKCKTNSQSSDSSSDTLVEEKSCERRVQAREMSTQTVAKNQDKNPPSEAGSEVKETGEGDGTIISSSTES